MKSLLVLLTLVAVMFAGCVGDDAPAPEEETTAPTEGPKKPLLDYEIDPDSANETDLMGAHTHDVWGSTDKITLLDNEERHTEQCRTMTGDVILAVGAVRQSQEVHKGCINFRFDDGLVVPEGTASLEIFVDASDALDHGSMQLWYRNGQREFQPHEGPVSDKEFTWNIPVAETEWDIPHAEETTWFFQLLPAGNPAVLEGSATIFIVAHKIPDWVPILGSAHIDHWAPDAEHVFVSPDIMQIMSQTVSVSNPSYVSQTSGAEPGAAYPLDDIVPPGLTTTVAAVLKYDGISGCPPVHEPCWVRPFFRPEGTTVSYPGTLLQLGPNFGVWKWEVPEPVVPDSTYAKESGYTLFMDIRGCPNGEDPGFGRLEGCYGDLATDLSADVTVLVEAYRGDFDPNGIQSRAGV